MMPQAKCGAMLGRRRSLERPLCGDDAASEARRDDILGRRRGRAMKIVIP